MPPPADLRPALRKAAGFLLQSRNAASGLWEDFASTAGPSTEWVTGFVLASLASLAHPDLRAAREKLLDCQRQDGSWGFCSRVPGDADSTAWAVLGLGSALPDDRRDGAARFLLAQQLGDRGGFRTYPGTAAAGLGPWAPGGRDHSGWQAAHTCVTGTVVLALAELGQAAPGGTGSPLPGGPAGSERRVAVLLVERSSVLDAPGAARAARARPADHSRRIPGRR